MGSEDGECLDEGGFGFFVGRKDDDVRKMYKIECSWVMVMSLLASLSTGIWRDARRKKDHQLILE
jgi:hypothetical protein